MKNCVSGLIVVYHVHDAAAGRGVPCSIPVNAELTDAGSHGGRFPARFSLGLVENWPGDNNSQREEKVRMSGWFRK